MKPYNERLPLIDAAIKQGLKQEPGDYVFFGKGVTRFYYGNDLCSDKQDFICTRDEFNQRAKELGYINGYKYGVEYETNGEKPDLPYDVLIQVKLANKKCPHLSSGWWYSGGDIYPDESMVTGEIAAAKGDWDLEGVTSFRIVDDRFKPKEQDMNDYNPTIGEVVIAIDKRVITDGNKCELKYISDNVCVLYDVDDDCEFAVHPCHVEFRPLRTETDKLVEQMTQCVPPYTNEVAESARAYTVKTLAEQGYRKIKPMSRDEVISKIFGLTDKLSMVDAAILYDSGCRFLDQGE